MQHKCDGTGIFKVKSGGEGIGKTATRKLGIRISPCTKQEGNYILTTFMPACSSQRTAKTTSNRR
jgi:hypothetical protein